MNNILFFGFHLFHLFYLIEIRYYYLHLFDPVQGAAHFDVTEKHAIQLINEMMAILPGFLMPKLVREIAGEANKTPINLS